MLAYRKDRECHETIRNPPDKPAAAGIAGAPVRAGSRELTTVEWAVEAVQAFSALPLRGIPPCLMQEAKAVAVIPDVIKAGFLVGGRFGRGVIVVRQPDGSWSNPLFVTLAGGGVGWQIGLQSTDVVLVFRTGNSLDRILQGKGKLTLGADVGVAIGPVGRQAEAATDGQLKAEIYSYSPAAAFLPASRSKGPVCSSIARPTRLFTACPAAVLPTSWPAGRRHPPLPSKPSRPNSPG